GGDDGERAGAALEPRVRHRLRWTLIRVTAATGRRIRDVRLGPHVALGVGAALAIAFEAAYDHHTSDAWLLLEALAGGLALLSAWRVQERLRLLPLLALTLAFNLAYVVVHLASHVRGDLDSRAIYGTYGQRLLDGHYPHSDYPVGAVLLFALEAAINGTHSRTPNAFLMIPFQLLVVA